MARGTRFDFPTCDGGKAGTAGSTWKFDSCSVDRQHAANVLARRRDLQRFEGREDVDCPTLRVLGLRWHQPHDLRAHCIRFDRRRRGGGFTHAAETKAARATGQKSNRMAMLISVIRVTDVLLSQWHKT